jgi:hypothetical protein
MPASVLIMPILPGAVTVRSAQSGRARPLWEDALSSSKASQIEDAMMDDIDRHLFGSSDEEEPAAPEEEVWEQVRTTPCRPRSWALFSLPFMAVFPRQCTGRPASFGLI